MADSAQTQQSLNAAVELRRRRLREVHDLQADLREAKDALEEAQYWFTAARDDHRAALREEQKRT